MKKFTAVLASMLAVAAIATTAIPVAAAQTGDNTKPPLSEERIQQREETAAKIAALLGIDVETLKAEREAGKKLMEIAEEHGASDTVIQQLKDLRKQMHGQKNHGHKKHRLSKETLGTVATAMGISTDDLIVQLKNGTKLKDLAEQYGVDLKNSHQQ